jgi:hypothetical protein
VKSFLSSALLLPALALLGALSGGAVASRAPTPSDMGIDQIAGAVGGVMVGMLAGLFAWAIAVRMLEPSRRVALALVALAGAAAVFAYLSVTAR